MKRLRNTGQRDDYTTGYLLDYPYSIENCKLIAIDLSKQQTLNDNPRAIQQIRFTGNLNPAEGAFVYFVLEEPKENIWHFHKKL